MSDAKQPLFTVEPDTAAAEHDGAKPALKTWVSPKVITATFSQDTASSAGAESDGAGTSHS